MRKGFSTQTLAAIKEIYNIFYRSGLNTSQAMEKALQISNPTPEQLIFIQFVQNAQRGISN